MAQHHRVEIVKDLYSDILSVTTGHRSANRFVLADVYQMVLAAPGFCPKKPISLKANVPANLRRKVDNGCSLCLSAWQMEDIVGSAKATLTEYGRKLKTWLEDNQVQLDDSGNVIKPRVKDLGSTLKIKK